MIRRLLAALVAVSLAGPASAACTWSQTSTISWKVVCDTGTEAMPTLATEGVPCVNLKKITMRAEAAAGQTFTAAPAGVLRIAIYNDRAANKWARCADCQEPSITEASVRSQSFAPFDVVCRENDRVAVYPNAVTLSAGNLTIYVDGYR